MILSRKPLRDVVTPQRDLFGSISYDIGGLEDGSKSVTKDYLKEELRRKEEELMGAVGQTKDRKLIPELHRTYELLERL